MRKKRELEASLEDRIVADIARRGGDAHKLVLLGQRGWPDRTCFLPGGELVIIEVKRPDGTGVVSVQQTRWRRRLVELGFRVVVVASWTDYEAIWGP